MKAIILIGGMGTRLRPLTCHTPKPMLPIVNRSFLEYQFELLKKHGIKEIVLCVSYLPDEFKNYFGDGKKLGVKLHYVLETSPLGTGGAIRNAIDYVDGRTLIFNGDILTDINLTAMLKFHKEKKAMLTIGLTRVKDPTVYGLVETEKNGKITRFLEKPSWDEITCNTINTGIYIFEKEVLKFIPEGVNYSVERGLFPNLLREGYGLFGYSFNGYWLDIGTIDKFLQANHDVINGHIKYSLPGKKIKGNIWSGKKLKIGKNSEIEGRLVCGENVIIGDFVQFSGNVCLGNNVVIGKGASIADSVILDDSRIDEGVRIESSLIGKNCRIEANSVLNAQTTLGNGTIIKKYSKL